MASSRKPVDRDDTPPFHIKVYYRTGAYLRTEELLGDPHPPHKSIYAWKDSTLKELSEALSVDEPAILPRPFIGTRLEFRHIFRAPVITNSRSTHVEPLRFLHKDIGSVVFGAGRPGASEDEEWDGISNDTRTLEDIRFVQGDHLICAIMPPDESTGAVVPANSARIGRGSGIGEAGGGGWAWNDALDGRYEYGGNRVGGLEGYGGGGRGGRRGPSHGGGGGGRPMDFHYQSRSRRGNNIPSGEWTRGEVPGSNVYR
ncbi:Sin3 associated polypeptide p18 (SAP18) domain containing protein [Naviculisporaceae sp. PSN 640]